jgi:cytochrome c-type biogenesis protein CcmH
MTLWFLMAALLLAAAVVATRPWWRGATSATLKRRGANVAAYHTRVAELEGERQAGLVPEGEVAALRAELDARLVSEAQTEDQAVHGGGRRWRAAVLSTLLLGVFSGGWYYFAGSWRAQQQLAATQAEGEQVGDMVKTLAEHMQQAPDNPEGWALLGRSYFVMQHYEDAAKAYGEANARSPQPNADWLAGQGESLGFARDRDLQGVPAQLFERALGVDPDSGKALWYSGMAAAQAGDIAKARARWGKLLTEQDLPPAMREALQTHIKELDAAAAGPAMPGALAQTGPGPAQMGAQTDAQDGAAAPSGPAMELRISLATGLAGKIPPGAVLFVFAKAEQGPPMPLAVQRLPGKLPPLTVKLDDSMAMAPGLRLSQFDRYVVTARLATGGAQAQSGDLEGVLHVRKDQLGQPLELLIDRVVP